MSKMMCIACNAEFPSDQIYLAHKKSGHKAHMDQATLLDEPPKPTPPPGVLPDGVPASAMPSPEFMETIKRIESKKEEMPRVADSKPSQHPSELPEPDPIVLHYSYSGVCPDDRTAATTLELDVDNKHFCIAFCPTCKKQLATRTVAAL